MTVQPSPATVDTTLDLLTAQDYVADRRLATAVFLALKLQRPLFLEGEAGVGKTEIAKVLAAGLGRPLVRLQCYEGLDTASAVYEWNYPRQMIEIRLAEAAGTVARDDLSRDIFTPEVPAQAAAAAGDRPGRWRRAGAVDRRTRPHG
jgi:MoxR-like ATPase